MKFEDIEIEEVDFEAMLEESFKKSESKSDLVTGTIVKIVPVTKSLFDSDFLNDSSSIASKSTSSISISSNFIPILMCTQILRYYTYLNLNNTYYAL